MRTPVTPDDDLMAKARAYTGLRENAAVIRAALKGYAEREAARRLILLGGSDPAAEAPPRLSRRRGT